MTLQQLRYAVEVAQTGSITKSAANLFVSQPNLSTALRELESEIGFSIFQRTYKGVEVTVDGETFLQYANGLISQFDQFESTYKKQNQSALTLRVAYSRSSFSARVFAEFYAQLPKDIAVNLQIKETTILGAINEVANGTAIIGKIFFPELDYHIFQGIIQNKHMDIEILCKVQTCILVSAKSPLTQQSTITLSMLADYTEIRYIDFTSELRASNSSVKFNPSRRVIYVNERGCMMDILSHCPDCYIETAPCHPDILHTHNLMLLPYESGGSISEAIVYCKNRSLSREMQWLINRFRLLHHSVLSEQEQ